MTAELESGPPGRGSSLTPSARAGDQWECQQTFLRFMQCVDAGDADGAVAQVAPDVVWHRQGERLTGPDAIRAVIRARPPQRVIRHVLSNIVVTLGEPDRASSKAYYCVYAHDGGDGKRIVSGPERVGDYHAGYARTAGGWRLTSLRAERIFTAAPAQ